MNKPRIKRDVWYSKGFTCRSKETGGWNGIFTLIASGDTPEQAYFNWRQKALTDPRRRQERDECPTTYIYSQ